MAAAAALPCFPLPPLSAAAVPMRVAACSPTARTSWGPPPPPRRTGRSRPAARAKMGDGDGDGDGNELPPPGSTTPGAMKKLAVKGMYVHSVQGILSWDTMIWKYTKTEYTEFTYFAEIKR